MARALRRRTGWTQQQLGERADTSRQMVSRVERDELDNIPLGVLRRMIEALGGRFRTSIDWHGEQLDRLIDADHARLQDAIARLLEACGWVVRVEVSFNHYGDRGRFDIIGFHAATGALLAIEIKVGIGDVQDLLGRLDVKVRLARSVANQFGWQVRTVMPMLVIAEDSRSRRIVRHHEALFRRFTLRGRSVAPWLRRPVASVSGVLLFRELPNAVVVSSERRKPG